VPNVVSIRNVFVAGKRTSLKLEQEIWVAIDDICALERISIDDLMSELENSSGTLNRASQIRCFAVTYFRNAVLTKKAITVSAPRRSERGAYSPVFQQTLQTLN